MRAFLRALFLMASFMAFSGCVDINLKSELPKVDYYELDNLNADSTQCGAFSIIALESIDIPQSLSSKNILYKDGNRIGKIEGINLSENLKSSVESMLIKSLSKHCIKVITPPFSGIKMEQFLKIKFLNFNAMKDSAKFGRLAKSSENGGDSAKCNATSNAIKCVDSAWLGGDTLAKNSDFKHFANVSFAFWLYQNGDILQSDIITQIVPIEEWSAESVFNALQQATNEAINALGNKIIAK